MALMSGAAGSFRLRDGWEFPVLEVTGEVDLANAQEFAGALDGAIATHTGLIVSLDDTTYFDSRGIHILLTFAGRLMRSGQLLALVAKDGSSPRRLLEIAGVATVLPIYGTIDQAAAGTIQPPGAPPLTTSTK